MCVGTGILTVIIPGSGSQVTCEYRNLSASGNIAPRVNLHERLSTARQSRVHT